MPTTVTKKIGATNTPVTMDYSSIQAWEDACPADLTAVDQIYRGECYNQGTLGPFNISGETTDATRYVVLTTGPGQSFRDNPSIRTTPLFPSAANGVYCYGNFNYAVQFGSGVGYTRIIGLQIEQAGASATMSTGGSGGVTIDSCIIRAAASIGGNFDNGDTWVNCLLIAGTTYVAGNGPSVGNCYNCTIVIPTSLSASAGAGIHGSPYGDRRNHHNCAVFGFAKLQDGFGTGGTSDYAATDATTSLEGAHTISGLTYASQFVNTATDFRTVATGQLQAGSPDSTHAPVDISGFTRDTTTPYIGCWEPAGTGGPGGQTVTMPTRASGAQVFKPTISKAAPSVATTEWVPIWDLKPPVTGSGTVTAHHATHEPGGTDQITLLALGTTPATTGLLRLANNGAIMARKADNSADIRLMTLDASNVLQLAQGLTNVYVCDGGVTLSGTALAGGAGAVTIYSNPAYNDGTTGYPLQLSWFGSDARILSGSNRLVLQSANLIVIAPQGGAIGSPWWFDNVAFYPAGTTNTQDIGQGSARVRSIYVATVKTSAIKLAGDIQYESALGAGDRTYLTCSADGNLTLFDHNGSDFGRLQFGGTGSGYPALKRNSTGLAVRLANDSADAPLTAGTTTVNGDLYVTGDVIPITQAQLVKIDLLEQRSVGDTSGSRTLLSQSYVSGLSLRHDQTLGLAKVTVGDYDQQVYQPLTFQSLSFQVATGTGPGTLVEHFRVHVSGGVTVGTDHSVDPGVGVIQASGGLGTTPGVALLNQRNVFTKFQTIQGSPTEPGMLAIRDVSGEGALLTLSDSSAPVNMRLWYLKSQGGGFSFMQADDNGGAIWSFQFYNSGVFFRAATGQTPVFAFNPEAVSFPRLLAQDGALEFKRNDNTGRVTLLAGGIGATYLDLIESQSPPPAQNNARIYALDVNGFTAVEVVDGSSNTVRLASDNVVIGKVTEPAGILRGQAVYISGAQGANALLRLAKADDSSTMPSIGLALDPGVNNAFIRVLVGGTIQVINTSAYNEGDALFVSTTVAGGYQTTIPQAPGFAQRVGIVTRSHATQGEMLVMLTGVTAPPRFHAPTHWTNGTDPVDIKKLAGYPGDSVLFLNGMGTFSAPTVSMANVALLNQANVFTANQLVTKIRPEVQLQTPGDTTKARFASVVPGGRIDLSTNAFYTGTAWMRDDTTKSAGLVTLFETGQFGVWRAVAGGTDPFTLLASFIVDKDGHFSVAGRLQIGLAGAGSPSYPAWRNTGAQMECVLGDNSNWASVQANFFYSIATGNNLGDLTVRGGTNFQGGITCTEGNLQVTRAILSGGVIYPGRVDNGAIQSGWYLGSHPSYGLYSNTGLYLGGTLTVAGSVNGTLDMATNILDRAKLRNYSEVFNAAYVAGNGYVYCDLSVGNHFYVVYNAPCTFVIRSAPPGVSMMVIAIIGQGANYGIGWYGSESNASGVRWQDGVAPQVKFGVNRWDFYTLYSHDGGTTWWGFQSGQNM